MKKRLISLITVLVLTAGLFAGCAQGGASSGKAYAAQDFAGNAGEGILAPAINASGELVVPSQAEGAPVMLTTYDTAGNKKAEITTDITEPAFQFALDGKDTAYLLAGSNVYRLDAAGKTISSIPVGDILLQRQKQSIMFEDSEEVSGQPSDGTQSQADQQAMQSSLIGMSVLGFAAASDGSVFISYIGLWVVQIGSDGKQIRIYSPDAMNLICMNEQEQLMIYPMNQSDSAITTYDTNSGVETAKVEAALANPTLAFYDKQGKMMLYMNSDGIYPVGADGKTGAALITLNDFSLSSATHAFVGFAMDGIGTIYLASAENGNSSMSPGGVVIDGNAGNSSISMSNATASRIDRLALVDASTIPQKKVLTIAGITADQNLNAAIDAFQKAHPDYRVECKNYSNEIAGVGKSGDSRDSTSLIQQFNTDVIAGNNADIYILDGLPYYKYIDKGLLADLGQMIEKDGLDMSQYYSNIFDACRVNGTLYTLPTAFTFDMLAGKEANMPAGDTLPMDEFFKAANSLPAGLAALPKEDAAEAFTSFMEDNYNYFVDQPAKNAKFGTSEFINLLNQFKALADTRMSSKGVEEANSYEQVGDGLLAFTPVQFSGLQELVMIKALAGEDVKLQSMPSMESGAVNFAPKGLYGMNASSKNKEIAWEFIKSLLSSEMQSDTMQMNGLPVNRAALQKIIEDTVASGENESVRMVISTSTKQVEVKPLPREEYDALAANFDKLNRISAPDQNIVNILNEELPSFFSGQKSAADVAALIQNRVETILNE